jgi:hypothetical protein
MVWDIGTYEVVEGNYYKGRIVVFINGKKRLCPPVWAKCVWRPPFVFTTSHRRLLPSLALSGRRSAPAATPRTCG